MPSRAAPKRDKRIQVRVTAAIYETIARVAAAERRTVAAWTAIIVEEAAERAERRLKSKGDR